MAWPNPIVAAVTLALLVSCAPPRDPPPQPPTPSRYETTALAIADFLLGLQNDDGALRDSPQSDRVNEDSNMEYALLGLAAAYRRSGDSRYLLGLEKGIAWLAGREEMEDPRWRGSWRYAYSRERPYGPIAVRTGPGIEDVRGVDATGALFVYLLDVHAQAAGTDALALRFAGNARAALDFLLARNRLADGSFASSWQKWSSDRRWHLWSFRYAADQADVYLGLQAGWRLYGDPRCREAAAVLAALRPGYFYPAGGRYALGRDEDGDLDPEMEGFNGVFPQGYLPWVFGDNAEDRAACQWLRDRARSDGSISCYDGDPLYGLTVAVYALAAAALAEEEPADSLDWLIAGLYDPQDGGVRDTAEPGSEKYSNVAGFAVMALLRAAAYPPTGRASLAAPPGSTRRD